jgi:hypothetical protein
MIRDITRNDLRFIVRRGLQETSGSYKLLVELLNMKPTDYKRFLNFLRKHECHVPFERFRSARLRPRSIQEEELTPARLADQTTPVVEEVIRLPKEAPPAQEVIRLPKDLSAIGTKRRWSDARRVGLASGS